MAVFKCKMCGGNLDVTEGMTACECEYCGTKQTVPNADNEKKINLFNRANRLRSACEFDKAASVYESILAEFSEEAEAYWGLCLCKFGIEYVDDPKTAKKVPTCHRTSYISIFDDNDFDLACEYADSVALQLYRNEAKEIDWLQREILNIAKNEEPFDIFICYKESDENGARTVDSELAHDLYDVLTEKGYKVFYSRITLKAKLGKDYEPYIFSALNSAKVMLAVGTKYEYYNAVWVKNEWSRFLALMTTNKEKTLIPCYRDIDAYDIPKEFNHLQGQDLNNPRAFQDLISNIERLIPKSTQISSNADTQQPVVMTASTSIEPLLKRASIFLEDGNWQGADEYCEKVLDQEPENPQAYLIKLCIEFGLHNLSEMVNLKNPIDKNNNYKKVIRFGDDSLRKEMKSYNDQSLYNLACFKMDNANGEADYTDAAQLFSSLGDFSDLTGKSLNAAEMAKKCEECVKECLYKKACDTMNAADSEIGYKAAAEIFSSHNEFSDSVKLYEKCKKNANEYLYKKACYIMNNAKDEISYKTAAEIFSSLGEFSDSADLAEKCLEGAKTLGLYYPALEMVQKDSIKEVKKGIELLEKLRGFKDSATAIETAKKQLRWLEYSEKIDAIRNKKRSIYIEKTKLGVFDIYRKTELNNRLNEIIRIENELKLEYKDVI